MIAELSKEGNVRRAMNTPPHARRAPPARIEAGKGLHDPDPATRRFACDSPLRWPSQVTGNRGQTVGKVEGFSYEMVPRLAAYICLVDLAYVKGY